MTKRHLTQQQKRRIQNNQNKRRQRAHPDSDTALESEQTGRIITRFGKSAIVQSGQETYRCTIRQHLNDLVCGDHVVWQPAELGAGVIVAIIPRENTLVRPDFGHKLKPVAANIDVIWIVVSILPTFDLTLVDQYTIAAEFNKIQPGLIINKMDLSQGMDVKSTFSVYQTLGYPVIYLSAKTGDGLSTLKHALMSKTSIFVGQSGVGKSSLINSLHPDLEIKTRQISEITGLGVHTTSKTTLYELPDGGELIDSPGIREFGLWHIPSQDIAQYFVEFKPFISHCKFSDCSHTHEPDCAIRDAVDEKKISPQRFRQYHLIRQRIIENKVR